LRPEIFERGRDRHQREKHGQCCSLLGQLKETLDVILHLLAVFRISTSL
jgi:hypothetical protein